MTPSSRTRDLVGLGCLYAQLVASWWIAPGWAAWHLGEPVFLAVVGGLTTSVAIALLHAVGMRGSSFERLLLAAFLGGMPLVYVGSWLVNPEPGWLGIELVGVVVYGTLAFLGATRSAWLLAGGILAHGLLWDAWHHGRTTFVPDWYAIGCLVADVGLGIYTATQVPYFEGRAGDWRPVAPVPRMGNA